MRITIKGDNIRVILAKKNKNYTWFAEQLGTSRQYVSMILNDVKFPSPKKREKIMKIFAGRRWDDLFHLSMSMSSNSIQEGKK